MKIKIVVVVVVVVVIFIFLGKNDKWLGFYYPDRNNLTSHIQSAEVDSLEECRVWVESQVSIYNPSGYGYDYECGKNCKLKKDWDIYVCEETLD